MFQTNISMERKKNHYIWILNQDNQPTRSIMSISQMKTRKLSMCNQEMSTHWSTHQMPHLLHLKFKLDPLNPPQWSRHFVDPAFQLIHFSIDGELDFYFEKWFYSLRKMIWSRHLFLSYFKRVNKIRKKTLSVTPYFIKGDLWKIGSSSGVGLLIEKVQ